MRVVALKDGFGLDHLVIEPRPAPRLLPGQVRLRMLAASLNYRDLLMVLGRYNPAQPLPLVIGSDGVGEVTEVGADVQRVAVGDRVCPIFASGWLSGEVTREKQRTALGGPLDGTFAEFMVLDAEAVVKVPAYLSDEEAACLPCTGVTAWSALMSHGRLQPGDVVLLQGTGGVSLSALAIAKTAGARVVITSKDDDKLRRASSLGADVTINYGADPDWGRTARQHTGGRGVDLVLDVGGEATLGQSLRAVRPGGTICIIGNLSGARPKLDLLPVLMNDVRLQGVFVGSRERFEALLRALEANRVRPVVDRVFELEQVRAALSYLQSGAHFGKVCLRLTARGSR